MSDRPGCSRRDRVGRVALDFYDCIDNLTTGKLAVRGHTNMAAVEVRRPVSRQRSAESGFRASRSSR
jgi:hypothetical protein